MVLYGGGALGCILAESGDQGGEMTSRFAGYLVFSRYAEGDIPLLFLKLVEK